MNLVFSSKLKNRKVSTLFRKYENNVQVPVALAFTTSDMWVGTFQ